MNYPLLDRINSPSDLKKLNKTDISGLSSEIRQFIIENVSKNGGHLASNLGVVEMTLAIHTVFNSPDDHIIFDVGHQSYVHKIITGRKDDFKNLRIPGGLSGFTSRRESSHDAFGAGHSSTSISAALGFAEADLLSGKKSHTVCVTGDGAFTGGMIHEALNNCKADLPLIIIINENGMSISKNKGAFASYLSEVRVSRGYRRLKSNTKNLFKHIPLIGKGLEYCASSIKNIVKKILYRPNYFEELGLYYMGPIDGNDYEKVCKALNTAKETGKTCVVHLKTVKGMGYSPAEESPDGYHSVALSSREHTFHSSFVHELISLAEDDKKIVAVTAAMGIGTGLSVFGEKYPERYFDVGIAEEHALTFAAGLAAGGYKPFVGIYSTFLQRGYDNLVHDIALQKLPVRVIIDRAGLAGGDGATHHGIFDVSFISHIPDMTLLAPISYNSLRSMIRFASDVNSPIAIRYPNAGENSECINSFRAVSEDIMSRVSINFPLDNIPEYIYITYGKICERVLEATKLLRKKGIDAGIVLVETIKPYDKVAEIISGIISSARRVVYVEEGIENGGAGQITREKLTKLGALKNTEYSIIAIDDNFASPTEICDIYDFCGLSSEKIAEEMLK